MKLNHIKTRLEHDMLHVRNIYGVTAPSFIQYINDVPEQNKKKARAFTCVPLEEFQKLRDLFCKNPIPNTDRSEYDFYGLKPAYNRYKDADGSLECGVPILLKIKKEEQPIDFARVMLKIQREYSAENVGTVSIYAYNHEPTERDVLREVEFYEGVQTPIHFNRIPFFALEWNVDVFDKGTFLIVIDKPQYKPESQPEHEIETRGDRTRKPRNKSKRNAIQAE